MPAPSSTPGDVSPSNIPAKSPWTSRRSSSATWRPSRRKPSVSVPRSSACSLALGLADASATTARVGTAERSSAALERHVGRGPLLRLEGATERAAQQSTQELGPALVGRDLTSWTGTGGHIGVDVKRVEA